MMSTLQTKKKIKTGIPVAKITPRNTDDGGEAATSSLSQQNVQSDSESVQVQNTKNLQVAPAQHKTTHQQQSQISSSYSSIAAKPTKKMQIPETWADEVIESHSQKLRVTSISESKRRREDMEKQLQEAEAQLVTMGSLLEQREKMMKEAAEEGDKKITELELKLLNQDGHLIKNGIDPVTGEKIMADEAGEKHVESSKKVTKKRVQEMREKLKQMNSQTESYLSDIENTLQFLNNLEAASDKFGQLSQGSLTQFDEAYFNVDEKMIDKNHHILTTSEITSTAIDTPIVEETQNVMMSIDFGAAGEGYNSDQLFNDGYQGLSEDRDSDEKFIPKEV